MQLPQDVNISRRSFLKNSAGVMAAMGLGTRTLAPIKQESAPSVPPWNHRFPSYLDDKTQARMYILTPENIDSQVMYQTHPMWTQDMNFFLFYANTNGEGMRPHVLEMRSGVTKPLLAEAHQRGAMTWKNDKFYYMSNNSVYSLSIPQVFQGTAIPERLGDIPGAYGLFSGDITVDADLSTLYFGCQLEGEKTKYAVVTFDLTSGKTRVVVEVDFQVGHFQANPVHPGKIMFCWETGGDAPQRTWLVNKDGSGLRPLYKEHYNEWVTHEVWWDADRVLFTIWPYNDEMRDKPHGVAVTGIDSGAEGTMEILSQYPAWHTHGSNNGKWVLGDDFDRNIWLIRPETKERKLLTQGHNGEGFKTHPHASFTPDGNGLVFNSSKYGKNQIFYMPLPDWEMLS